MDEDEKLSSGYIHHRDLNTFLNHLTTSDADASSDFDDDSKQAENTELQKTVSNFSNDSINNQIPASTLDTSDSIQDPENQNIQMIDDCRSNDRKNEDQVFILNAELTSTNKPKEENLTKESAASNSPNKIPRPKDLEISLEDTEETLFDQKNGNPEFQSLCESDLEIISDKRNTVEIVPEKVHTEEKSEANPDSDGLDVPVSKLTEKQKEQTVFNSDDQIQETVSDENSAKVENMIDEIESIKTDNPHPDSSDHLIRSKSVAELSTIRTSRPNSLAEDAKLVKFSVSSKSVNIMQSNAQFLNKSRNFLNFITEKSTNIMEKTLLPQNLAAKYNSILRMTDNNPANYKKFIQDTPSSSDAVGNHSAQESGCSLGQGTETSSLYNREQQDESGHKNSAMKQHDLFLKCSVNEDKTIHDSLPETRDNETTSANIFLDQRSENKQSSFDLSLSNSTDKDKISNSDLGATGEDEIRIQSNISDFNLPKAKESPVFVCKEIGTSDAVVDAENLINGNEIDEVAASCRSGSNGTILPSLECLDQEQMKDEHDSSRESKDKPIDLALLSHPAYMTLLRDYSNLKDQSEKLCEEKVRVEMENQRLAAENNGELYVLQLETLEKTIEQLRNDLKQATASQELMNREYILANKEKESMVMKYAISEKQLIDTQRAREYAERKINEALKEQELLHTKLKQVQGERTRICNILDGKCHELTDAQKEVDRLKEELSMREVKLKWTQNKLKTELEIHKDNQQKLDKAMLRINEMKEECEQVRKESHETIRKFQQSEENKVVNLDHQLKEQQARLILERHVTEDKEMSRLQLQKEVEILKQRQHALIEENNTLSLKVQNLEKDRLNYDNNLSNLKVLADQRQKEIVDLVGKVSQLETLKLQLKHTEQLLSSNEAEVERLRQSNTELQSDMEWCREREAHMLEFTQKLTDKNVRLQSEFTSMEAKNEQLELEQGPLYDQIKELSSKVKSLEISLASEKSKRTEECELLARHVAEQTQLARNLAQKLEDCQGENAVLRRKQQISVKEMTKELQQCKKRLDAFETGSPSNSLDRTSRTGSSSSLSTGETLNGAVSDNSNSGDNILQSVEPDRQTLIDRIVKLQRIRVRQAEKLDFLEEHTQTLVNELQKKSKIIKNYILHENPDAMGSNERDRNKAELARHGGIMASVYNQRVSDDNMTLELSLEINQKLQAVLEDTLLKNITLKDSIDTLGGEIARLTMQSKRRQ